MGLPGVGAWGFGLGNPHPGLALGTELSLVRRGGSRLFGAFQLAGYRHAGMGSAVLLSADLGYRCCFSIGLEPEVQLGLGYMHAFQAGHAYGFGDDGRLGGVFDKGRSRLVIDTSLGLAYSFPAPEGRDGWALFFRYQLFAEVPFSSATLLEIPAITHTAIHLGVRVPLDLIFRRPQ